MKKRLKQLTLVVVSAVISGCVPIQAPNPNIKTPSIGTPVRFSDYGRPPQSYRIKIKNYFANKLKRGLTADFKISAPKRAFKRKGLAYGGEIDWKGWMVDVSVATHSRTGRLQKPKPYMVLFNDSEIVEDILGSDHKLLTRVGD